MALTPLMLAKLVNRLQEGHAIASMGYPDITAPEATLKEILGERFADLRFREDSDKIARRHGFKDGRRIPDSESFFECFGAALDVYDIVQERGDELLCDLNYAIPERCCGQYDFVLDVGTLEHCFNVAQALVNMASLVKVGGCVFHENPHNWGNHGFYNFNPTLFHDFYTDNGFEVESIRLVGKDGGTLDVPHTKRFTYQGPEVNLFTVVRRLEVKEITFPTQTKYRRPV